MLSTPFPCLSNKPVGFLQAGPFTDSHVGTLPAWKHTHTEPLVLPVTVQDILKTVIQPRPAWSAAGFHPPWCLCDSLSPFPSVSARPAIQRSRWAEHTRVLSRSPAAPAPAFLTAAGEISPLGQSWPGLPGHAHLGRCSAAWCFSQRTPLFSLLLIQLSLLSGLCGWQVRATWMMSPLGRVLLWALATKAQPSRHAEFLSVSLPWPSCPGSSYVGSSPACCLSLGTAFASPSPHVLACKMRTIRWLGDLDKMLLEPRGPV